MNESVDSLEVFPRSVFSEGSYTVLQYGQYLVDAPGADRHAALTYMARDVQSAREMMEILAEDPPGDLDNTKVHQALCIAAIVMYAKGFKRNNARKGLIASEEIAGQLQPQLKGMHDYVLRLRDKYAAHDDGIGEDKERRMAFPLRPASYTHEVGIIVGTRRVVSIGSEKAKELLPLYRQVEEIVSRERDSARLQFLRDAIGSNYAGITLTGRYVERELGI